VLAQRRPRRGGFHQFIPSSCEPGSRKKPSRFGGMEGGFAPTESRFQYIYYPNQHRKLITLGVGVWQWRSRFFQRDNPERRSCIARSWCRQVVNASQKPRAEKGWCVVSQYATSRRWVLIRTLSAKQIIFSQRPGRPLHCPSREPAPEPGLGSPIMHTHLKPLSAICPKLPVLWCVRHRPIQAPKPAPSAKISPSSPG
jgi:hypothetical protein